MFLARTRRSERKQPPIELGKSRNYEELEKTPDSGSPQHCHGSNELLRPASLRSEFPPNTLDRSLLLTLRWNRLPTMLRNLAQKIEAFPRRLTRLVPNPGKQQLGCLQNLSVGYSQVQRDTVLTKSVVPKTSATCLDWSSQLLPRCHHAAGQIGIPSTVEALLQKLLSTVILLECWRFLNHPNPLFSFASHRSKGAFVNAALSFPTPLR